MRGAPSYPVVNRTYPKSRADRLLLPERPVAKVGKGTSWQIAAAWAAHRSTKIGIAVFIAARPLTDQAPGLSHNQ